jgi:hypothetical protein
MRLTVLLAAVAVATAMACAPVSTVCGRPAAVLPQGATRFAAGGGVNWYDVSSSPNGVSVIGWNDEVFGYATIAGEVGLGHRTDMRGSWENGLATGTLRTQVLGQPLDEAPVRGPVDISLEAGAAGWLGVMVGPYLPFVDAHVGVNISAQRGRVTPYASLRHHWVNMTYYDPTSAGYPLARFRQNMCFIGVELRLTHGFSDDHRLALEFFWGGSTGPASDAYDHCNTVRGLNLVFSGIDW